MDFYSYIFTFIEGILTFISPCILPLLPVYFFYLAGISAKDNPNEAIKKNRLITNSLGFVLGFTIVFVVLGAAATSLGSFLRSNLDFLRKAGAVVMFVFGLNYIGIFKLKILNFEKRMEYNFKELKFFNSIIFGIVFGFGWTPCVGALLGSALILAGSADTILQGVSLLVVYSAGLGIPFILAALALDRLKGSISYIKKYSRIISLISGILLISASVLLFFEII